MSSVDNKTAITNPDANVPSDDGVIAKMTNKSFGELPKMHTTYANIIKSLMPAKDKTIKREDLPQICYEVPHLVIDEGNLNDYRKICGFVKDGRVPATYFAVVSQTLQMNMMATENFPFAMLGLVHIFNQVTQHRVIYDSEVVRLTVHLDNLKAHDKGQQFDFVTQVYAQDVLVWSGVSTYLSRQKQPKTKKSQTQSSNTHQTTGQLLTSFDVPEDIGRRYAFVSGDFNLIHLHPLSARAFGFPRAIAHGMWSKAKVLAQLPHLPTAYTCQVAFKQPIFLPSAVDLWIDGTDGDYQFALCQKNSERLHLVGHITAPSVANID